MAEGRRAERESKSIKYALAVNRTRGSRMASANFTTKPLVQ